MARPGRAVRTAAGAGIALAFALAGCVVGPKYAKPAPPPVDALPSAASVKLDPQQRVASGSDVQAQWWALFHSPELDALIGRALAKNADVEAAAASLRAARESWLAARGAYAPAVEAGAGLAREKNPAYLASPLASNANIFDLYTAQLGVSYAVDVFGGVRRQVQGAAAEADQQRFELEAARLALTANLTSAVIQEAAARDQIAATRRLIQNQQELLEVLRTQLAKGQAARTDVTAQELALAQAQAALPPLQRQDDQLRDQIAALCGGYPTDRAALPDFTALALPADLPTALPSQIVEHRPDIRAAEANLRAANAAVGVAAAARLPSFTVTAAYSGQAGTIGSLLNTGNQGWLLGADVAQPVFQGYALKHRQRAAEAAFDQARAQYRSTVIASLQSVADTLHALETDAPALEVAEAGDRAAEASLALARRRFAVGETGSIAVMAAVQTREQAAVSLSQARAQRLVDTVALFQALGGGWWNRKD
jgi:NodT family efflux transporter outer membrane factor (OMF) lipoprotein